MAGIKGVPQAFPYQGSKRKLASFILPCIPENTIRLVEPFAGSAAITVAAAYKMKARKYWINDSHKPIAGLWRDILENPQTLLAGYEKLWTEQAGNERPFYDQVRDKFNSNHATDCFLYLLARCVKAAIRYNRDGKFNNSPDNRRKGMHPDKMSENITFISGLLNKKTRITNFDYEAVLNQTTDTDVIYMDPPYQGVCQERDQRYYGSVQYDDFVQALKHLNNRGIPYIVSYDGRTGDKLYGERLPDFLNLEQFEIHVGKSTQSTLLGRSHDTYESLYLSCSLIDRLGGIPDILSKQKTSYLFAI